MGLAVPHSLAKYFHLRFFQQSDSSSVSVFFFFLLYRIVYRTTSACTSQLQLAGIPPWATWDNADFSSWPFQRATRGLHKTLWPFTAKSSSQNSGQNSSSSKNKDNAGRMQVLVFIPGNIIKGSRGENTCFCHAFIICRLSLISCSWWFANKMSLLVLERTLLNHWPLLCCWLNETSHTKGSTLEKESAPHAELCYLCQAAQYTWFSLRAEVLKWTSCKVPHKWLRLERLLRVANPCVPKTSQDEAVKKPFHFHNYWLLISSVRVHVAAPLGQSWRGWDYHKFHFFQKKRFLV